LKSQFIIEIACGETHCIVLSREGKVFGWGMSMYGQLGLGFSSDSFEPGIGLSKSKVAKPTEIT
jgi:alpha-tubulin suppressor-like RCC1 family protein